MVHRQFQGLNLEAMVFCNESWQHIDIVTGSAELGVSATQDQYYTLGNAAVDIVAKQAKQHWQLLESDSNTRDKLNNEQIINCLYLRILVRRRHWY